MTREEIVPERLARATAVVVDEFLATTTLLTILENGARRVFPVASMEDSGTDPVYLVCASSAGRFTVEDFLGAATILSHMSMEGSRLNDGAWMALDFMKRYRNRELEALKQSRAGRWFFEHDRVDAFEFVGETGSSELVPEVRDAQLVSTLQPSASASQHGAVGASSARRPAPPDGLSASQRKGKS